LKTVRPILLALHSTKVLILLVVSDSWTKFCVVLILVNYCRLVFAFDSHFARKTFIQFGYYFVYKSQYHYYYYYFYYSRSCLWTDHSTAIWYCGAGVLQLGVVEFFYIFAVSRSIFGNKRHRHKHLEFEFKLPRQ
jgi:hypothetical protein